MQSDNNKISFYINAEGLITTPNFSIFRLEEGVFKEQEKPKSTPRPLSGLKKIDSSLEIEEPESDEDPLQSLLGKRVKPSVTSKQS